MIDKFHCIITATETTEHVWSDQYQLNLFCLATSTFSLRNNKTKQGKDKINSNISFLFSELMCLSDFQKIDRIKPQ